MLKNGKIIKLINLFFVGFAEEGKDGTIKPEHKERLQKEHQKLVGEVTLQDLLVPLYSKGLWFLSAGDS